MTHTVRLPRGWATAALGDITSQKVDQGAPVSETPYIDISSIDRGKKEIGELRTVDADSAPTRARQWVKSDDVLVSMTRPNLNAVAMVPKRLDGAVASTGFDVLRAVGVLPSWIFNRVRSREFVRGVCQNLQGVVYPAIRPKDVRAHELPIPPLPEQHRIVEAIESYLTRLDDAIASLERVQRNLNRYRASVLKAAVEGRLVPTEADLARQEGRDYEPASELLKRILAERKTRWIEDAVEKARAKGIGNASALLEVRKQVEKKYREPEPPDATDLPDLPEGWCWTTLDQFLVGIDTGKNFRCLEKPPEQGQVGVVKVSSVSWGRFRELESKTCLDPERIDNSTFIQPGDFLISRANTIELVGACVIVDTIGRTLMLSDKVLRLRFAGCVEQWLLRVLRSRFGRQEIEGFATGNQESMRNISQVSMRKLRIPLPPGMELARILEYAASLDEVTEAAQSSVDKATHRTHVLRQAILKWAFEGKLVEQDPDDEPAAALLERIAERRASKVER